ncbi:MAG: hypothetical protein D8M58_16510 [Calditrichaeota bacterium]|nr:MAG: hypothetical protein DWQ03_08240 [Calditrichota bacterium]MBL1207008.1 hypothetical protein [Calditrichota bacterium]NOG46835.1 hypothetical protein [Calditrichota bacterium]
MKSILICSIMVILISFSSCKKRGHNSSPTAPDFEVPKIVASGNEQYLKLDSEYIFDQNRLATFELKIPGSALEEIDSDPAAEEYVEGMLIFEGDTISPVGIRYKGSVGAFVNCVSGSDWANPSGYKTCTKLSMKIKINWKGRQEKFYKLKKLQFHSQNLDPSQMHERLGYWLFREMGVPAPRSVHARLMINGEYSGLYALTEQVDGRFTRYNFDDGKGNLYKEIWPLHTNGTRRSSRSFLNALKTNEDDNPSVEIIKSFAQQLQDAEEADVQKVIEQFMDIEKIVSFIVVDRMIRNDDGPFHWYCHDGGCGNHNYYWYEEPAAKKLHLIPWDMDNAFENIIHNENPVTPIAGKFGDRINDCRPFKYGDLGIYQWASGCDKLTAGWASYTKEFEQLKKKFINGPFSEAQVNALLIAWTEQIREATLEASDTHDDALSVSRWERELDRLKRQLEFARNK